MLQNKFTTPEVPCDTEVAAMGSICPTGYPINVQEAFWCSHAFRSNFLFPYLECVQVICCVSCF